MIGLATLPTDSLDELGTWCGTRRHRCVSAWLDKRCDVLRRCRTTRVIRRYRYVGARPPHGTTGPDTLPTGPIVARLQRTDRRPGRLIVALRGVAAGTVTALSFGDCFSGHGRRIGDRQVGGVPLTVKVPSRFAPFAGSRAANSCQVAVLIVGHHADHVHARLIDARGR